LAVETMASGSKGADSVDALMSGDERQYNLATLFATPNDGILLQEFHRPQGDQGLLGLHTPYLYYLLKPGSKSETEEVNSGHMERATMRDFQVRPILWTH
jgi:hypothetical protein